MNTQTTIPPEVLAMPVSEAAHSLAACLMETEDMTNYPADGLALAFATGVHWEKAQAATHEPVLQEVAAPVGDADMLQVIDERDRYHEVSDDLAAQIAAITGQELGEHSSINDPWRNAMLAADEFIAQQLRDLLATASRVPVASVAEPDEDFLEGVELLKCLMANIEKDGNYSKESTIGFLNGILHCFQPANPTPPMAVGAGGSVGAEPIGEVLVGNMTAILYDALPVGTKLYLATPAPDQATPLQPQDAKDARRYLWLLPRLSGRAYREAGIIYSDGIDSISDAIDAAILATPATEQAAPVSVVGDSSILRALLVEWLDGMYDGPDFLRRVKLAVGDGLKLATKNGEPS